MKKLIKRIKKKPILIFTIIFFLLFLFSNTCLIYSILRVSNIENLLRYLISILLIVVTIYFFSSMIKIILKGKNIAIILYDILFITLFITTSYACTTINNLYSGISNIYKQTATYEVSAITKKDSNIENLNNIKGNIIGLVNDKGQKEINEISIELINETNLKEKNKIKEYSTSSELIEALYNNEVNIALIQSNYVSIFSTIDSYKNINTETKEIAKKTKTIKKETEKSEKNEDEPFTVLILGMDSTRNNISTVTSFNADSIMLLTFNPKTYNATILSIPRDTYVPISCINGNPKSKITHAGWNGESCVIRTIENWMDIPIDYYVKVNFTAVVSLVDAIGGIEVNVPYSFCEQNSNREWGKNTIYVKKGLQTLNGEQALALSRNRHPNPSYCSAEWTNYYSDDIIRGQNQQLVINALINKVAKSLSLENIYSIFDVINTNVDTNMQINEITNYYNVVKEIALKTLNDSNNLINFERLTLSTYGKYLYDPLLNSAGMSMQIYYEESFKQIVDEMKVNLELIKPTLIKTFSFSINNPYKKTTIGTGAFKQEDIKTVPNFKGKDKAFVQNWAYENGITIIFDYQENSENASDIVLSQSIKPTYKLEDINENQTFKITLSKYIEKSNLNESEITNPLQDLLPQ